MLEFLRRGDRTGGQIGYHRTGDGLAVAHVAAAGTAGGRPRVTHCSWTPATSGESLATIARPLPHRRHPCVSVLAPQAYSMLLVEAPDVPQDELRAAVRWRIKELLDFHIDDAVIDVFQMPHQGRGGPNQMMYAIAARNDGVRAEVDAAEAAGLNLQVIDVLELSLRNIAALLENDSDGVAMLYLGDSGGILLLVRQGVLYLTRRIDTGTRQLADASAMRGALVAGLALEARRSLDYFESHYEQSSIPVVYTSGLATFDQDQLADELGISIRNIDLSAVLGIDAPLTDEDQRHCLPAIGAALRSDEITL
jgi:MSHA biogenesis protein MshI